MTEIIESVPSWLPIVIAVAVVVVLLLILHLLRRQSTATSRVKKALSRISAEMLSGIVIPKADDGQIQLDMVLLTAAGILVIEYKDVEGVVFGSDRMQDWTVMNGDRRYTFANPQMALFDRVAAVRQIASDIPVNGRILFGEAAKFTKGIPTNVAGVKELLDEFPKVDGKRPPPEIQSYYSQWERLREEAVSAQVEKLFNA